MTIIPISKCFNSYKICGDYTVIYVKNRHGDILETIIDTCNLKLLIDLDWCWCASWYKWLNGYYVTHTEYFDGENGKRLHKTTCLHKFLLQNATRVDHLNNDSLDNRMCNLRASSVSDNGKNRKSKNSNNTSGYRNVSWSPWKNSWVVQLQIDGKNTPIKFFPKESLEEAGNFAEEMRNKYYGEFSGKN